VRDVFQKAVSLIWDIVQSVDRRAGMVPAQRRAAVSSTRRELIFIGESYSTSEQQQQQQQQEQQCDSATDATGGNEQTRAGAVAAALVSAASCHVSAVNSEDDQQNTDGLHDLETATSAAEKHQEPPSAGISQSASSESPTAGKPAAQNRPAKKHVQIQEVVATDNTMSSCGTTGENINTEESIVADSGATADTAEDVLSKDS